MSVFQKPAGVAPVEPLSFGTAQVGNISEPAKLILKQAPKKKQASKHQNKKPETEKEQPLKPARGAKVERIFLLTKPFSQKIYSNTDYQRLYFLLLDVRPCFYPA